MIDESTTRSSLQLSPNRGDHLFGLADEALSRFQEAVTIRPDNAPAQGNLGKAFLQKGNLDEAMTHYRRLLQIEPDNLEAHNILGTAFFQEGKVDQAIGEWQRILAIDPDNGNALSNLAWVMATYPDASIRNGEKAGISLHAGNQ